MKASINGITLAYEETGSGLPVVLIHGFPLCRQMWRPQAAALAAAGYRVVAADLRGFGESEAGEAPFSMGLLADDVAGLLDHLGIEKAVIGGMSMGGYVLLDLLERHPQRAAAAMFLATRAAADDEAGKRRRTALAAEVLSGRSEAVSRAFEAILFADETPLRQPQLVAEVTGWMRATDPRALVGGLLAMRDRIDGVGRLPFHRLPALVVGAMADRAVPVEHSQVLAEGLPNASLCLVAQAGHMANLEQPEAFNRCLLEFLGGLALK